MNYAMIENGTVSNIIFLLNNLDFPEAIPTNDLPVEIGDTFNPVDGRFYRNGEKLLTSLEAKKEELADALSTIDDLCDYISETEE